MKPLGWILLGVIGWLPVVAFAIRATPSAYEQPPTEWPCAALDKYIMTIEETMAADELTYHLWRMMDDAERSRVGAEVNLDARVRLEPSSGRPAFAQLVLNVKTEAGKTLGCISQKSASPPFNWELAAGAALMGVRRLMVDWPSKDET